MFISEKGILISTMEERVMYGEQQGEVFSPKYFLYVSLFLYPLISYLSSKIDRLIFNISILLFLFFSLAMGSRGTTLTCLFVVVISNLYAKNNNIHSLLRCINMKFVFLLTCLFLLLYIIPVTRSAIDYLIFRFQHGEEYLGASRYEEAIEILKNLTQMQFLFGKGLGGANTYWIFSDLPQGVNTVHYGWAFLILKGGIILLCLVYGRILLSIWKLWKIRDNIPYAIILITFILLEFSHTNFNSLQNLSFMFIALSCDLSWKNKLVK
jgi:hypothetical protein